MSSALGRALAAGLKVPQGSRRAKKVKSTKSNELAHMADPYQKALKQMMGR